MDPVQNKRPILQKVAKLEIFLEYVHTVKKQTALLEISIIEIALSDQMPSGEITELKVK